MKKPSSGQTPTGPKRKGVRWAVVQVLLLAGGAAGAYWWLAPPPVDPQVAEVRQLFAQAAREETSSSPEQRQQLWQTAREKMEELSDEQRQQVFEGPGGVGEIFRQRLDQQVETYFSLPPEKRQAFLDEQIDRMEQRRREFEAARQQRQQTASAGTGGGSNSGQAQPGDRSRRVRSPVRDVERSMNRRRRRLDRTDAETRAKRSEYFAALRKRREERGLPPWPGRF